MFLARAYNRFFGSPVNINNNAARRPISEIPEFHSLMNQVKRVSHEQVSTEVNAIRIMKFVQLTCTIFDAHNQGSWHALLWR
jgi:hypothetical protein